MKIWAKTKEFSEGKFLVVRRDGTIPAWPHFVLGARDPATPSALRAYAEAAAADGCDPAFVQSVRELADDFDAYRAAEGNGDPDAAPHRHDDPRVIAAMRGYDSELFVRHEPNRPKVPADAAIATTSERVDCGACRAEHSPPKCEGVGIEADEPRATELEWLRWFAQNADFGPADGDVRAHLRDQFVRETGKRLPIGWDGEDDS